MAHRVLFFGPLAEISGQTELAFGEARTLRDLESELHRRFPALANSKYIISVNREIQRADRALPPDAEIALLPPFSGG